MNPSQDNIQTATTEDHLRMRIATLEHNIKYWGIAELMIRNANVNSFVKEMEERVLRAEAKTKNDA